LEVKGMRTLFQAQIAVLVVKVVAAHGAVEVVVGVHFVGVGCGRGRQANNRGVCLLMGWFLCGAEVVVCLVGLPLAKGSWRRDDGDVPPDDGTLAGQAAAEESVCTNGR
jgi:hypothetical protein